MIDLQASDGGIVGKMTATLKKIEIDAVSDINVSFYEGYSNKSKYAKIVVVSYSGKYRVGCLGAVSK